MGFSFAHPETRSNLRNYTLSPSLIYLSKCHLFEFKFSGYDVWKEYGPFRPLFQYKVPWWIWSFLINYRHSIGRSKINYRHPSGINNRHPIGPSMMNNRNPLGMAFHDASTAIQHGVSRCVFVIPSPSVLFGSHSNQCRHPRWRPTLSVPRWRPIRGATFQISRRERAPPILRPPLIH